MIEGLPDELAVLVTGFLLVMFRVAAVVSMMPALGEASIPARVKLGIAVGLSMITYPAVITTLPQLDLSGISALRLAGQEVAIGLMLGLLLRIFLFCLQIAGSIAAQSTSLSQILGTAGVDPLPALGYLITMSGLALAMLLGLHIAATSYIVSSYSWSPPGQIPNADGLTEIIVAQVASGFRLAFAIAAPFYILALLYNLTLGVINRAMPQLMVAFVGAPVITAGALVLLAVASPLMITRWKDAFFGFMQTQGAW